MMCQCCCSICGEELIVQPKPKDKLLGMIVDNDNSVDEAIIITSADDVIIIDDETKGKIGRQKRRRQHP